VNDLVLFFDLLFEFVDDVLVYFVFLGNGLIDVKFGMELSLDIFGGFLGLRWFGFLGLFLFIFRMEKCTFIFEFSFGLFHNYNKLNYNLS